MAIDPRELAMRIGSDGLTALERAGVVKVGTPGPIVVSEGTARMALARAPEPAPKTRTADPRPDLLALSHAGKRLRDAALAAYYAADRGEDQTKLREALAALDRCVEIAKQFPA